MALIPVFSHDAWACTLLCLYARWVCFPQSLSDDAFLIDFRLFGAPTWYLSWLEIIIFSDIYLSVFFDDILVELWSQKGTQNWSSKPTPSNYFVTWCHLWGLMGHFWGLIRHIWSLECHWDWLEVTLVEFGLTLLPFCFFISFCQHLLSFIIF